MTSVNDEIWVTVNKNGTATITTGKTAPNGSRKVAGLPSTIQGMASRIAKRNGGSPNFLTEVEADAALVAEEMAVLANVRP